MSYKIRTALPSDGAALSAIYAPYTETAITYEYPAPTAEEFSARIAAISAHYPFIVCESDGRALGYAYSHRYRERAAYDWDTELSIYFDRAETGRGLGRPLYSALLDLLRLQGFVNIYGTVSAPNSASERLHESLGFTHVFTDYKTGWKLGKWHDLIFYRLQLAPAEGEPGPVTPFPELDAGAVREIYERRAAEMGGRTR